MCRYRFEYELDSRQGRMYFIAWLQLAFKIELPLFRTRCVDVFCDNFDHFSNVDSSDEDETRTSSQDLISDSMAEEWAGVPSSLVAHLFRVGITAERLPGVDR